MDGCDLPEGSDGSIWAMHLSQVIQKSAPNTKVNSKDRLHYFRVIILKKVLQMTLMKLPYINVFVTSRLDDVINIRGSSGGGGGDFLGMSHA